MKEQEKNNINNTDNTEKDINAINKEIKAEMGMEKLNSIFTAYNNIPDGTVDKDKASQLIGLLERGFIPVEMRQFSYFTSFINKYPDFKMDYTYNENIVSNAVNDRQVKDVNSIRSIDNPSRDSMLGNEFGRFMGIDTSRSYYLKDEEGSTKNFKEELYGNFDKEYYNNVSEVYIINDIPRQGDFKNPDHNYIKDIKFGDKVAVKDFVALQITTFEVHKIDGDIEYKSYFTNGAGQILAEIPDSGDAQILLGDSRDSKCEAINTAKIELSSIPRNFDDKFRGSSMSTIEGAVNRQSYSISKNAELTKNEVDVLSENKQLVSSALNCMIAEKYETMSPLKEEYTKLDNSAKTIANIIKIIEKTDKTSDNYDSMLSDVKDKIADYKETLTQFDEKYKNTELFDDNKLNDLITVFNDISERLDNAAMKIETADSDIIKGKDENGNKIDPLTRFRGIIGIDRPSNIGSNIDINGIRNSIEKGKAVLESRVNEWNESHKDSPLKIDETSSGIKIYDKHGFERDIQDIVGKTDKIFNPEMVDDGASRPEKDEDGNISKEEIDGFVAEDEDVYKEFSDSFEISDIIIDSEYESLIEKYVDEDIDFTIYSLDNQAIKDELAEVNGEKIEYIKKDADISNDSDNITNDLINYNDKDDDVEDDEPDIEYKGSAGKSEKVRPDSKHIDYKGKVEVSKEKKDEIARQIMKELKGVSNENYTKLYNSMYESRVQDANDKLTIIADKINTLEKGVKNRTDRLGARLSNQNLIVINDRSKIDGLLEDYKKAGGAIGKGEFVKSTPTFLDKFARVSEAYHSNIFNTGILEIFLKVDNFLHPEREEPYKVDTDRSHLSKDEEPKEKIDNEKTEDDKPVTAEEEPKEQVDNEKVDEEEPDNQVLDDKDDDSPIIKDSDDKENIGTEDVDIPEETENEENDDIIEEPDKTKEEQAVEKDNDDKESSKIEEIKAAIQDKIEDYFNEYDTISDKLESFLDNLSPMDLADFCIEAVTSIYEHLNDLFHETGNDTSQVHICV